MLQHWKDYEEFCGNLMGKIITITVHLEIIIDQFIANHFTYDKVKNEEIRMLWLWHNIGLTRKKEILKEIIETHEPDFLKAQPNFFDDLIEVIKCRNIIAHRFLDHRGAGTTHRLLIERKIVFKGFKPNQNKEYTELEIIEIESKANNCANAIAYWKGDINHTAFPLLKIRVTYVT